MELNCYVINGPNNNDNIFLNKKLNILLENRNVDCKINYCNDYLNTNIIFAESLKLTKNFIDINNIINKIFVVITQEVYHDMTMSETENYKNNKIYVYNTFNKKFYLNHFYYFSGIPGCVVDISKKNENNYNTSLCYFGNIWRQNWHFPHSIYKKRLEAAIIGYKKGFISKIYSRDFCAIEKNSRDPYDYELEADIENLENNIIRNVSRNEKIEITKNLFYSLEFISTDIENFVTERPFDAILAGCVPVFMGNSSFKNVFPVDSIIYVDEFKNIIDCFEYVKNLKYEDWKKRIDKCVDILFMLVKADNTGDNLIIKLFKNIVNDVL